MGLSPAPNHSPSPTQWPASESFFWVVIIWKDTYGENKKGVWGLGFLAPRLIQSLLPIHCFTQFIRNNECDNSADINPTRRFWLKTLQASYEEEEDAYHRQRRPYEQEEYDTATSQAYGIQKHTVLRSIQWSQAYGTQNIW